MSGRRAPGEGSVFWREDRQRWCAKLTLSGGKSRTRYAKTRREAQMKLAALCREAERDAPEPLEKMTVGAFLPLWLERTGAQHSLQTQNNYRAQVETHLVPAFGAVQLQRLDTLAIEQLQRQLLRTRAPSTVHGVIRTLKAALKDAVRWGYLARSPAETVRLAPTREADVEPLTPDAARAILAAFAGHRYEAVINLALMLGMRQGEILGLRWCDVDLAAGQLRISGAMKVVPARYRPAGTAIVVRGPTKTPRSMRTLPLPERVRTALLALPRSLSDTDALFLTAKGEPLQQPTLHSAFRKGLIAAGLPVIRFRDLRHGCASLLLADGVPVSVVVRILGHSTSTLTLSVYNRMSVEALGQAADAINRLLNDRPEAR